MTDVPEVRVSDAEREQAVASLREHTLAGRLTLEEFSARVEEAYGARTKGELERVARELPEVTTVAPAKKAKRWTVAIMGGADRKGRWRVPRKAVVVAIMGGADLDLRRAEIESPEVTITAFALMGGIDIYVPEGVEVDLSGFALMGGNDERGRDVAPRPGAPLIRVRAFALMGGIDVWRVPKDAEGLGARELRRELNP